MIGHLQIITARKVGLKPKAIFINAGFDSIPHIFRFDDPEQALDHSLFPTVTIAEAELGQRLDLRFVTGCRVHVNCKAFTDAVLALADAVVEAGATSVAVLRVDGKEELMVWKEGTWSVYES